MGDISLFTTDGRLLAVCFHPTGVALIYRLFYRFYIHRKPLILRGDLSFKDSVNNFDFNFIRVVDKKNRLIFAFESSLSSLVFESTIFSGKHYRILY